MNEQIEIEYKILLTKEIYNQILKDYKDKIIKDYIQTNHYLIHPLLQQKRYMLRIREKNNQFELTLKRPSNNHRLETNINIDKETVNKILNHEYVSNKIMDILIKEGINPLELKNQFSLTTHRCDIKLEYGILSLDENTYLDITDYELEYEVNNEKEGFLQFLEIIKPYQLTYFGNCASKIKRVLNHLG